MELRLVRFSIVICILSAAQALIPLIKSVLDLTFELGKPPSTGTSPSPSPLPGPPFTEPIGTCELQMSRKCVDVTAGNRESGTKIEIFTCNQAPAQTWTVPGDGTVRALGKCMDVTHSGYVQLYDCNGTPAQQWVYSPNGQFKNQGKCLDIQGGYVRDMQPLITYYCKTGYSASNQVVVGYCKPLTPITTKTPQPTGSCVITINGICVDVTSGNSASGTLFEIYVCNGGEAQNLTLPGDGTIKAYGKCMDVKNNGTGPVQLYECNGSPAQKWVYLSSGQWKNLESNKCLDVTNGTVRSGEYLIMRDCDKYFFYSQSFETSCQPIANLTKVPQPTGKCTIKVSTKCVDVFSSASGTLRHPGINVCDNSQGQYWTLPGNGTIKSSTLGKCMGVKDGRTSNLASVQLYDCNGSAGQQWSSLSNGQVKHPFSDRCLFPQGGVIEDGQRFIISDCMQDNNNQTFQISCT